MALRVGIVSLMHESNTFIRDVTTRECFVSDTLAVGSEVVERFAGSHHEIGGFLAGLAAKRVEIVPIFAARAVPYGVVEEQTYQQLLDTLFQQLSASGPLDGLLAAAHGATVSQQHRDADGHWLTGVRRLLGPHVPIIATIDLHANVSAALVDATDMLVAYQTNPHADQFARGLEAADSLVATIRGGVRPTQAAAMLPMAINIECQQTDAAPCLPWFELAASIRAQPDVLSASVVLGFPYADVPEMGCSALVITNNDPPRARRLAGELADFAWRRRETFRGRFTTVDEAVDRAGNLPQPVLLLDMGDNVGGGSPGDGTALAAALHRRRIERSFVCLCDPQSVARAADAGISARIELAMGGKADVSSGEPLSATVRVCGLYDGEFEEPQSRHGGFTRFDQGRTAVVQTDTGLTLLLTSRRVPPWSLRQLTSCRLDPAAFRMIVAKGVVAPVAAYKHVCPTVIRVDTPGCTSANLSRLTYRHRRRPLFPFEEIPDDG